jgi:hypothetical protein
MRQWSRNLRKLPPGTAHVATVYIPAIGEYEIPLQAYGRSESGTPLQGEISTDFGTFALYVKDSRI